jgi:hypothetical protein
MKAHVLLQVLADCRTQYLNNLQKNVEKNNNLYLNCTVQFYIPRVSHF